MTFLHVILMLILRFSIYKQVGNINNWNSEKKEGDGYMNSIFKPICICLQEISNSEFIFKKKILNPQYFLVTFHFF